MPPLLGPIARYRQPGPPRRSLGVLVVRGFGWFVLAVAVVASGAAGGLYLYTHETLGSLNASSHSPVGRAKRYTAPLPSPTQPAIALIAGYDHRAGTGTNSYAGSNSDTLMLVRADPIQHTLSLLSLPRDLWVPIYCHGDVVDTQSRINSAWALCGNDGPSATLDTMEHLTGLKINYLITLDFRAFKELVNRLHGVYLNIDRRYYIAPHTGTSAINLHPGYQKLDGGQALSFVRFRHFDSDIYRTGRQQLFLDALKSRLRTTLSLTSGLTILHLIHALKGNLAYVKAGGATVSISEIRSYLGLTYHLPPGHLFRDSIPLDQLSYPTINGASVVTTPQSAIDDAVKRFEHPDVKASEQLTAQAGGTTQHPAKKKTRPLAKSRISVLVLNAGSVPGEAANTSYLLAQQGYTTRNLPAAVAANAPAKAQQTTVYYDPVQPNAKKAASQIQPLFGSGVRVAQMTTAIAAYAKQAGNPLTVVTVGQSFNGKLAAPKKTKVAAKLPPPQVSDGVSVTATAIRDEAGKTHFPLMVPHEVAQYSQLSTDEGVRLFNPLHGRQELALTFLLPSGIYWQVEETNWSSAPILANPSGHIPYHGHTLDLYTTAGAIQMVALRTPKATYMVVNSILNELSNSTMLAIAKSLTLLGK